jgi:hypothetical protein
VPNNRWARCVSPAYARAGALCLAVALGGAALAQPPAAPADGAATVETRTDPDGRYTVRKLFKKDIRYRKRPDGTVRVLPYFQYRLIGEDADSLYVKEYLASPDATAQPIPPTPRPPPPPPIATGTVDRIRFSAFDAGLPTTGQWRNKFQIADLDRDGHPDIIHGPPRKSGREGPRVFLGDSAGHWRLWGEARYPRAAYDYGAIAVADFDADGHLDLALGAHLKGISVLAGQGAGRFRLAAQPADLETDPASHFTSRALLAHDWNRDGKPDLIALGEGPAPGGTRMIDSLGWTIYLNQGGWRWRKLTQNESPPRVFGDDLAVGDVNGDGAADLVTSSSVFGHRQVLHLGGAEIKTVALELGAAHSFINAVTMADFDGDGRDDIAVAYLALAGKARQPVIEVLRLGADGAWQRRAIYAPDGGAAVYALAAGDADGDGRQDLVAADEAGALRLFLGDGQNGFDQEQMPELAPLGAGCRGHDARLVDLDGDRRADLVAAFASEYSPFSGEPGCPGHGRLAAWKSEAKR